MRKIALIGNPNCGKTTLFNILTGANQKVGNWPGVTVEKKFGHFSLVDDEIELLERMFSDDLLEKTVKSKGIKKGK